MKTFGERIADALIADGVLTSDQLNEALDSQKKHGGRMLKLLLERGHVTEHDMISSMGRCLGTQPVNLAKMRVPSEIIELIPKDMALSYKMAAVARLGNKLFVAMADPLNVLALDDLRRVRQNTEIIPLIATEKAVVEFLNNATAPDTKGMEEILKDADVSDVEVAKEQQEEINLDRLVESTEEGPVIKLVNLILVQAVKDRASDIHIEPFEKSVRLRYRVDGVLYDSAAPPKSLQSAIASRIKIMAHLDIAERRLPQDGRFRIKVAGRDVDLRVSVLPTVHGEKIVMRVLDKGNLNSKLETIGMDEANLEKFKVAIDAPHGMMLMTGPTGSGKTSTLYAVLTHLNQPDVNIVTVEDPVEYQMLGVNQVQVKTDIGLTFAGGLRSILRQDPDIVMVGEVRDSETADIAVKAALTGHLVLTTLHTNDAPGAVARMVDMGIEPFLVSSSLLLVCAQRLVRKICPHCKEEFALPPEAVRQAALTESEMAGATFYRGRGCSRCKDTGFLGRTAIHEVMSISDTMREQILHEAGAKIIRDLAIKEGMTTLRQAGIAKAKQGITSIDEVLRVTGREA